jgi:membrane peptidoglycan carboxypeptidase
MMVALSKDDTSGTAAGAAGAFGWHRPMAGKTGTTQQHKSAGFVGVVPQLSAAVITFDNSRSPRPLCDGGGAPFACGSGNIYGGKTPAQTWFRAMTGILAGQPELPLAAPDPRYINGGAQKPVPDVVGRGVNEARALLQRAGWQVSVREVDGDGDPGTVQAQNPSKSALPGTVILLEVSNGSGSSSDESTSPSSSNGDGNEPDGGGPGG